MENQVGYNTFYFSWHEAMSDSNLTDEQYGRLSRALNDYCFFGIEPELTGIERTIFIMAAPNIKSSNTAKTNGKNGGNMGKGGAPRRNSNALKNNLKNNPETTRTIAPYCLEQYPPIEKNNSKGEGEGEGEEEREGEEPPDFSFSDSDSDSDKEIAEDLSFSDFGNQEEPPKPEPPVDKPSPTKEDATAIFQKARNLWNERELKPQCRDTIIPRARHDCLPTFQNYSWLEIENAIENYCYHVTGKFKKGEKWVRPPPYGSIYGFLESGVSRYFNDADVRKQFMEQEGTYGVKK